MELGKIMRRTSRNLRIFLEVKDEDCGKVKEERKKRMFGGKQSIYQG